VVFDRERAAEIAARRAPAGWWAWAFTDAGPYAAYEVEPLDGGVPGEVLVNTENGED
jgi:hypothetical protein